MNSIKFIARESTQSYGDGFLVAYFTVIASVAAVQVITMRSVPAESVQSFRIVVTLVVTILGVSAVRIRLARQT